MLASIKSKKPSGRCQSLGGPASTRSEENRRKRQSNGDERWERGERSSLRLNDGRERIVAGLSSFRAASGRRAALDNRPTRASSETEFRNFHTAFRPRLAKAVFRRFRPLKTCRRRRHDIAKIPLFLRRNRLCMSPDMAGFHVGEDSLFNSSLLESQHEYGNLQQRSTCINRRSWRGSCGQRGSLVFLARVV